jgi:hypothetical protein
MNRSARKCNRKQPIILAETIPRSEFPLAHFPLHLMPKMAKLIAEKLPLIEEIFDKHYAWYLR